jgi:hypothetical protein
MHMYRCTGMKALVQTQVCIHEKTAVVKQWHSLIAYDHAEVLRQYQGKPKHTTQKVVIKTIMPAYYKRHNMHIRVQLDKYARTELPCLSYTTAHTDSYSRLLSTSVSLPPSTTDTHIIIITTTFIINSLFSWICVWPFVCACL